MDARLPRNGLPPSAVKLALFALSGLLTLAACERPKEQAPARPILQNQGELPGLLARNDSSYRWERAGRSEAGGVAVEEIRLTSQTWQGIPWRHKLQVFRAPNAEHPEFCLLYNTGDSNAGETALGAVMATLSGCTVAVLNDVPNQPLFGDRREDALIAYTWGRFFETGDPEWVLNVPMTRSVLRAMDAIQAAGSEAGGAPVTGFCVTGASKRGWTSWLAGASGDPRVKAIAPMVFDMLNIPSQVPHQIETLGKPSEMIADYTNAGLINQLDTPQGRRVVGIVDPYVYRDRITMPKLIVLGTNDRYWSTDALNLYWNGLKGEKSVLYLPNSGHGLNDRERLGASLAAFARMAAAGKPLPRLGLRALREAGGTRLFVTSDVAPKGVRVFRAAAPGRDFRDSRWTSGPMERSSRESAWVMDLTAPGSGYAAAYAEAEYVVDGSPLYLSTPMTIQGAEE